MSQEAVTQIISKAVSDQEYRELLFTKPDEALAGHDLTEDETTALKKIQRDTFDGIAGELEERVSRAGFDFNLSDIKLAFFLCDASSPGGLAGTIKLSEPLKGNLGKP